MKKNRSTLKDYFKKGAIPTESNFADLIDSMLNQEEDSISKLPNDPLKITAIGVDEALVNFYRIDKNAEQLSWQVKQKLGGVAGLSISDTVGSRLFIENATGKIGLGTTAPKQALDVRGRVNIENGVIQRGGDAITATSDLGLYSRVDTNYIRIVTTNAPIRFYTDGGMGTNSELSIEKGFINASGKIGIGIGGNSPAANLDIQQEARAGSHPTGVKGLYITGNFQADSDGVEFRHSNASQGIGFGFNTIYAAGANTNQDLGLKPRGTGKIIVKGPLQVTGGPIQLDGGQKIAFSDADTTNNLKVQLWTGYGLGINNATLFYAADGNHSWRDSSGTNERMLLTTGADGGLTVKGTGNSSIAGSLGIGTTTPRSALDTFKGVLTGAANDYTKAQFTMSGGGTVTWGGPGGRLKWTARFIAISMEKSITFASGYMDMNQPTVDLPAAQVYDGKARSADATGIVLYEWDALYAIHTVGGDNTAVTYRIVRYTNNINAPSNWILVAVANGDDRSIRLGTGVVITQNSSSSHSSPIPRGVITLWSGAANGVPGGWSLCDGSNNTPDLRDRFIVGAGASYNVGATGGAENVTLTTSQMPSHNHANGDYQWLLQRDSSGRWTSKDTDTSVGEPDLLHSASIQAAGGNQAHENRPPYYALAYIMKL